MPEHIEPNLPTRAGTLWFHFRASCFRSRRWVNNLNATAPKRIDPESIDASGVVIAESRSLLFNGDNPAEFALQAGKVHNLRQALPSIHGIKIRAGKVFSFWAQIGAPLRARGFVTGRELREGCVIPSTGGGLCQLSNALYDAALTGGLEIVERHAHSQRVPGSMAVLGRDATVFWNYVDLRLRAEFDWQIEARLTSSELQIRVKRLAATVPTPSPLKKEPAIQTLESAEGAESCETCGLVSCFRNPSATNLVRSGVTAWLVDAWQPEHDRYVRENRKEGDWLFTPLDSARRGIGPYRWTSRGFARVKEAPFFVLERSWRSRRLAAQGAARQRALLAMDAKLARTYARRIPPEATHIVTSQNLLPFLWREGVLGGRPFDVLMTRLPMKDLQAVLDRAAAAHRGSPTLADFRAPQEILAAESEALEQAASWITPHRSLARLANGRAMLLDWERPGRPAATRGEWAVFPASTLGRKGAYELREALRDSDVPIRLCGPVIEEPDFWHGFKTERFRSGDWLAGAKCVVLPAWVENQPRRILEAVAAGVPVIVSDACGLDESDGVITVPAGDSGALRKALEGMLASV